MKNSEITKYDIISVLRDALQEQAERTIDSGSNEESDFEAGFEAAVELVASMVD
jgi:hypothetical protein